MVGDHNLTTTKTKLEPALRPIINAITKAHAKANLPGTFLALLPESNRYYVLGGRGAVLYQYSVTGDKLTVFGGGVRATVNL